MTKPPEACWGYTKSGRARVFWDGILPPNWYHSPDVIADPAKRDSWAVTLAAKREEAENLPVDEPDDDGVMPKAPEAEAVSIPVMTHQFAPHSDYAPRPPETMTEAAEPIVPRRRGRPPGSKNKAA